MKKSRDLDRLRHILGWLQLFEKRKIDLLELVQQLNVLTLSLETLEKKWYWDFKKLWAHLEAIYYSATTHGFTSGVYPKGDAEEIRNRIQKMKKEIELQIGNISIHRCPSCGYDTSDSEIWTTPSSSHDICDCCGLAFGKDETSLEKIREYRNEWLQHPMLWHNPQAMPENWKLEDQMEHIPPQYL